jgi:hypothetical protein
MNGLPQTFLGSPRLFFMPQKSQKSPRISFGANAECERAVVPGLADRAN